MHSHLLESSILFRLALLGVDFYRVKCWNLCGMMKTKLGFPWWAHFSYQGPPHKVSLTRKGRDKSWIMAVDKSMNKWTEGQQRHRQTSLVQTNFNLTSVNECSCIWNLLFGSSPRYNELNGRVLREVSTRFSSVARVPVHYTLVQHYFVLWLVTKTRTSFPNNEKQKKRPNRNLYRVTGFTP